MTHSGRAAPITRPIAVVTWVLAALALILPGCRSSASRRASLAEREGRHHEAYEIYCAEAKQSPSARGVRGDISRVAPKAARYWQTEGDRASARGRHAEAWKLYMRALEITPDNTALVSLVRNLEEQHPESISSVKDDWLDGEDRVVATAEPVDETIGSESSGGSTPTAPRPPPAPPPVFDPKPVGPRVALPPPALPPGQPVVQDDSATSPDREPARQPAPRPPPPPVPSVSSPSQEEDVDLAPPTQDARYQFTTILSTEDKRFPKRSQAFDGLRIRLIDTDAEFDADFDVELDGSRAKKARNVPPGRGVIVRGRSGKWYEVVVLTVVHTTKSMRVGVRLYNR